jgi:hypothetical protein
MATCVHGVRVAHVRLQNKLYLMITTMSARKGETTMIRTYSEEGFGPAWIWDGASPETIVIEVMCQMVSRL